MTASSGTTPTLRTPMRLGVIVPVLLTVILLPASLIALVQPVALPVPFIVVASLLFVALHAASFLASRRPVAALAAASAIMLVLALFPVMTGIGAVLYPSGLAYLVCVHQVAVRCERRYALGAIGVAVAGSAIVAITTPAMPDPLLRLGVFVGLSAANAAAWAFGLLQRVRTIQTLERERARMREARAAERARISAELHDVVAHSLTVMIAQADVARGFLREQPDVSDRALGIVLDSGRDALRGMRGIVRDEAGESAGPRVRAPHLDAQATDAQATDAQATDAQDRQTREGKNLDAETLAALIAAARSPETRIEHSEHGTPHALPAPALLALLPVVREGLTNAIRHTAPPRAVRVHLDWGATALTATIDDDGGSATVDSGLGTGTGLVGLAERVGLAGGSLESGAVSGGGWRLRVVLPMADAGTAATRERLAAERSARERSAPEHPAPEHPAPEHPAPEHPAPEQETP